MMDELDSDQHMAAAIKALREASWHLSMAGYEVERECRALPSGTYSPVEAGACRAVAELLAAQTDAIGTQARRLRKRARNV